MIRLSIGAKILLGISIILAMGLVCMLTIYRGLTTVQASLDEVVSRHAPATEVVFRLAHDVNDIGLHVMRYMRGENPSARTDAKASLKSFAETREKFTRQASAIDRTELARRLEPLAERYAVLAAGLVDSRSRAGSLNVQGHAEIRRMERLINDRLLASINMEAPDGYDKDVNAKAMLDVLNGLTQATTEYFDEPSQGRAQRIDLACNRFEMYVARYHFLRLTPAERSAGTELRSQFERFRSRLLDDRSIQKRIGADADAFLQARFDIDTLLEKEIERLSVREMSATRMRANEASEGVARTVTILLPLFFLSALWLGMVITRVVTIPVRKLMEGTTAVREGDLTCRIRHKSHDEFASLAENFNRMVEQLEQTTVSRDRLEASERQLLQVNSELEQASRRKNEFLAMLGHELRNPLGAISNAVELMRLRTPHNQPVGRPLEVLSRQVGHMGRLVDDLLDVSRITRGKIELRHRAVELLPLIEDAVVAVTPLVKAKGHRLRTVLPKENVQVFGDPTRLEQILINLLSNAAKYTEPGGSITLRAEIEREGGTAASAHANGSHAAWITLAVADNGIGIEPDMLPRVFELFAQSDRALDRSQGGLGIGLTLVRGLVELHGGSIEARSAGAGHGSEFIVRLPVLGARAFTGHVSPGLTEVVVEASPRGDGPTVASISTPAGLSMGPVDARKSRRAVIVDDNIDAAESLQEILEDWGWQVTTAHDGLSAVQVATQSDAEVVLLDIGLPGIDGYEVARRLRERDASKEASAARLIVALTGYGAEEDVERARKAGFDYHLVKPVDLERLRMILSDRPVTAA